METEAIVTAIQSLEQMEETMTCKHESDCKGYTPGTIEKLPLIKVEAWYWAKEGLSVPCVTRQSKFFPVGENIWKQEYTFDGQPDWKRLINETLERGADVVRVTPMQGAMDNHAESMTSMPMTLCIYEVTCAINNQRFRDIRPDTWVSWSGISDADIEAAIREHHKLMPDKPEPE